MWLCQHDALGNQRLGRAPPAGWQIFAGAMRCAVLKQLERVRIASFVCDAGVLMRLFAWPDALLYIGIEEETSNSHPSRAPQGLETHGDDIGLLSVRRSPMWQVPARLGHLSSLEPETRPAVAHGNADHDVAAIAN